MPFNAGDVIDQARVIDMGFSETNHPDTVCLPYLTLCLRRLVPKVARHNRDAISSEITIALPLDDFEAGAALEQGVDPDTEPLQFLRIQDGDVVRNSGQKEALNLMTPGRRFSSVRFPAAYIRETTLHLVGEARLWNAYTEIRLRYWPMPASVDARNVSMPLPDDGLDVLAWKLAAFLASRRPKVVQGAPASIVTAADQAERAFLDTVQTRVPRRGKVRNVR